MASLSKSKTAEGLGVDLSDAELFTSLRYDPLLEEVDNDASFKSSDLVGDDKPHSSLTGKASPFYMLDYHRDRLLEAAAFLKWTAVQKALPDTATMEAMLATDLKTRSIGRKPTKIRFAITQYGKVSIGYMVLPRVPLNALFPNLISLTPPSLSSTTPTKVFLDTQPTLTGPTTTFKTNIRAVYDAARARFQDVLPSGLGGEVLIIDGKDEVLEGTLTSVYFFRSGRWITPPVATAPQEWRGQKGTTRRWALERGLCVEEVVRKQSVVMGEDVWLSNGARGFWIGRIVGTG